MDTSEGSVGGSLRTDLKIGIIGLGSIGKRHADNLRSMGYHSHCYDVAFTFPGYLEDIFACDAVVIASPTATHYEYIKQFHDAKIPMFVEKPLVATRKEWELVPLSRIMMVGYNLRFHSCVQKARDWMGSGAIGKPLWARFTCAQRAEKEVYLRDGVILNWSHEIDLALHLLGGAGIITATATQRNPYNEDMADIILGHHNGCQTTVHLDYLTGLEQRGFTIIGEDGSIEVNLLTRQAFHRNNRAKMLHSHFGTDTFNDNYHHEMKTFLAILDGGKSQPPAYCTAKEAHDVADICLEAREYIRYVK